MKSWQTALRRRGRGKALLAGATVRGLGVHVEGHHGDTLVNGLRDHGVEGVGVDDVQRDAVALFGNGLADEFRLGFRIGALRAGKLAANMHGLCSLLHPLLHGIEECLVFAATNEDEPQRFFGLRDRSGQRRHCQGGGQQLKYFLHVRRNYWLNWLPSALRAIPSTGPRLNARIVPINSTYLGRSMP